MDHENYDSYTFTTGIIFCVKVLLQRDYPDVFATRYVNNCLCFEPILVVFVSCVNNCCCAGLMEKGKDACCGENEKGPPIFSRLRPTSAREVGSQLEQSK